MAAFQAERADIESRYDQSLQQPEREAARATSRFDPNQAALAVLRGAPAESAPSSGTSESEVALSTLKASEREISSFREAAAARSAERADNVGLGAGRQASADDDEAFAPGGKTRAPVDAGSPDAARRSKGFQGYRSAMRDGATDRPSDTRMV